MKFGGIANIYRWFLKMEAVGQYSFQFYLADTFSNNLSTDSNGEFLL